MAEHIILVEFNEKHNFNKITCSEGCLMTTWVEGDDIRKYSASKLIFAPVSVDTSIYHCVTEEEHNEYMRLQEEAILADEEEMNREIEQTDEEFEEEV